jgi:hypothetical protein
MLVRVGSSPELHQHSRERDRQHYSLLQKGGLWYLDTALRTVLVIRRSSLSSQYRAAPKGIPASIVGDQRSCAERGGATGRNDEQVFWGKIRAGTLQWHFAPPGLPLTSCHFANRTATPPSIAEGIAIVVLSLFWRISGCKTHRPWKPSTPAIMGSPGRSRGPALFFSC